MVRTDTTRVLVLVKAAPQPSRSYGDTVCVAGLEIRDDAAPTWIRLYPVPFRYLDGERGFRKYDLIEVATRPAGADKRPESRKINAESVLIKGNVGSWSKRAVFVEQMEGPTMCEVLEAVRQDLNAPSLAAVRPRVADGLLFEHHPGWSADQRNRFEIYRSQGDLFAETPPRMLEAPRLTVRLSYHCETPSCEGHKQRIIDWELNALQRRYRHLPDEQLQAILTNNFLSGPFADKKRPMIFVGNQENPQRRASFTVLGLYYPAAEEAAVDTPLF